MPNHTVEKEVKRIDSVIQSVKSSPEYSERTKELILAQANKLRHEKEEPLREEEKLNAMEKQEKEFNARVQSIKSDPTYSETTKKILLAQLEKSKRDGVKTPEGPPL